MIVNNQPRFLPGDMVYVKDMPRLSVSRPTPTMVVSTQHANSLPDAMVRGIADMSMWTYWVLTANARLEGPLWGSELLRCEMN
jgi:hypothetical protein